jgi:hypothetical protein
MNNGHGYKNTFVVCDSNRTPVSKEFRSVKEAFEAPELTSGRRVCVKAVWPEGSGLFGPVIMP